MDLFRYQRPALSPVKGCGEGGPGRGTARNRRDRRCAGAHEFASVATRKLAMTIPEIREVLSTIRAVCVVRSLDIETHELGLEMAERYGFSIYDGLIVAAAVRAGSAASSGWRRIIRSPAAYLFTHYILPI